MARLTLVLLAFVVTPLASCLEGASIPVRNVRDVAHDITPINTELQRLVVENPNLVRVGTEFRVRIYHESQREPVHVSLEHVYVPPQMSENHTIDLTPFCGEAPETCGEYRAHAVLLNTYWLSDR